ncbi:MAG: beta-N-acetylglucosaminidase domain-containing protein [Niameybacter sp.]|uniref:beta-N-acetylglucosaminidase domain-containing protein n=1 Tax=Niameybacter sp. TaxID=2033640 RepID=UPI002FCBDD09
MCNTYTIFPVPQNVVYGSNLLSLTKTISIVQDATPKTATLNKLEEILIHAGFEVDYAAAPTLGQTTITFKDQTTASCAAALNKTEGYTLSIAGDATCTITIAGCDADGLHYGVMTLGKILTQMESNTLQTLTLTDYPEILYRGYIEGFYGFPWSHEDRKDLMVFGGEHKLNTYIYAPKDDPYHRSHWREFYPADKAAEIAELAACGHANNLNFVWTIHPGDSIDLDSESDFQSTIAKLEQLYTLGVRQFGILFDDIGGYPDGAQQARYINRVDTEFVKAHGDIRPLITVGTRYCEAWGPSMEKYFKPFVALLHDDVEIMWTGSATMSNIAKEQFDAPKREIGTDKNLSVWWNYPVNDYCDAKLLMGKIDVLNPDVDNINGFFSNPMNQAQASKQALFCIADHNWNTDVFNAELSFVHSFKAIAPEVAEDLQIFASNCCYVKEDGGKSGAFLFDESWYLRDDITALTTALDNGTDITIPATNLANAFDKMAKAVENINTDCKNAQLLAELSPFLDATLLMGAAGVNIMEALLALKSNDIRLMELKNEVALRQLEDMEECKVLRLKDGAERYFTVDVGTLLVKPFLQETLKKSAILAGTETAPLYLDYSMNNIALVSSGVTATASDEPNDGQEPTKAIDGTIKSGKWCSRAYRPHLTLDLQEIKNIKQYRIINCGHPEAGETRIWNTKELQILASTDGETFTLIDEVQDNTADIINRMLFSPTDARFIRLQIIEPAQISINGGGHTRIYAFELFEEGYPEQSRKVQPSEIEITADNKVVIRNIDKGDIINLYTSLEGSTAHMISEEATDGQQLVTFENVTLSDFNTRIFVERTAKNYLPSVRTSKGF